MLHFSLFSFSCAPFSGLLFPDIVSAEDAKEQYQKLQKEMGPAGRDLSRQKSVSVRSLKTLTMWAGVSPPLRLS